MIISINNLGEVGIISDRQPQTLPPNAYTLGTNVRFNDGNAERVPGYDSLVQMDGQVLDIMPYEYADNNFWLIHTAKRWYSWTGTGSVTEISSTYIQGNVGFQMTGGAYNGVAVINNGVDVPQMWTPDLANSQDLSNWPSTWRCKSIRPFRAFLIALGMTEDGVNYPTRFRWSTAAEPGTVPTEWTATAANQAGSDVIEETQGAIIDAEPLRDSLVIYKTDSAYLLNFIGGQFVMSNRPLLKRRGILAQRCATEYETGKHFVVDVGDIYVHDGQNSDTIVGERIRDEIFDNIDEDAYERCFVTRNAEDYEVWFCYPESGQFWPSKAATWNWRENTWGFRTLDNTAHIAWSSNSPLSPTGRKLAGSREDEQALYPATTLYPSTTLYPDPGLSSILEMNTTWQADGSDMACTVTRTGLQPEQGDGVWMCRAMYPRGSGGDISVRVGKQDTPNATVSWEGPFVFSPEGTQEKINCRVTGRYLAYEITFPADEAGSMASVDFDVVKVGTR